MYGLIWHELRAAVGDESDAMQVGTVLESYEDADIPFFWFNSIGAFWVRI